MAQKLNTYLGQKGYTIPKNELTIEKQKQIRSDLTIKPYVPGCPAGNVQKSFPVYRESANKMYVPHYYGIENFGPVQNYKISEGENIDLDFVGSLRENQEIVVKTYVDHINKNKYGGGLLELPCAYGKCLGKNTDILMYNGEIKKVQDIIVNDLLMGDDSTPRKVLSLAHGREQMYKINNSFDEEDSYICNESHILSLKYFINNNNNNNNNNNAKSFSIIDISVKNFLHLEKTFNDNKCEFYGYKVAVDFCDKTVDVSPYVFGVWLGNNNPSINHELPESFIVKYELNKIKHIPNDYLCNSREKRLLLIAGLIDSTGIVDDNFIQIIQANARLTDDIVYLARSLGFACYKTNTRKQPDEPESFLINIYGEGVEGIPVSNAYKKSKNECQLKHVLLHKFQIEKLEVDDYYGFEIDGNRRFILGNFIVTHNTVLSLNIISRLKKKTFIIVHKEFLMNQWIERIEQFLPNAKVGKIQGQIIDIENKDIVIGMLQSLSMKDYPSSIFDSFGLTIIDEVHHISSEVFSNSLFKLVTKYMLGLSATMTRKDGTTKVFKMFLGDIIFKGKRDEERNVTVRGIEFKVHDEEFNKVITDFRGSPAYSSMISKLCEYNRRSEFILKVITDMLIENPAQQIMILAHNKNVLKYLHDAIMHRNIATAGYYLGGMKETALKETETKKIVIATYAMAAEALDIKTLTTLIMATPKTDIEQSVGRILREKHSNPVVVDIVDSHDLFKNQWQKRRKFYCKENYKIIYTNSVKYTPEVSTWTILYEPNSAIPKICNKPKTIQSSFKINNSSLDQAFLNELERESIFQRNESTLETNNDNFSQGKCFLKFKK